ncbi:copia protein [Tanacetum coccineum]
MSRTMLNKQSLPQKFWCNAVDTSTYILNRILIRAILGKTPYELLRGRKPTLDYFRVFESKCFNLNTKDYLTKFDPKSYEVTFDETPPPSKTSPLVDDDLDEEEAIKVTEKKNLENDIKDETLEINEIVNIKESRNHPLENVIGNLNQRTLISQAQNQKGIDYDETYAPVARLESIRILLAYACALNFKLFQMDLKSAFLNGFINEEVPKTSHLEAVKRIFRYLKGTTHLGLWYPKGTLIETVVYVDSDHAEDYVDQKSTSEFAQILDIPCEGACVFTDKWSLEELAYGVPMDGPYQTNPPSLNDIISSIRIDREGQVRHIRHEEEIDDHVPACLCYMLYCVVHSEKFNLAYYMAKQMEWVTKQKRLILPYGMLLTRLFKLIMNENHELYNESYVLYNRVMNPLAAQQERKTRKNRGTRRGRHSTFSSSTFDQPSYSHLNDDDDDGNGEWTLRASTPSPIRYVNSLTNQVPQVFQNPPNIDPHLETFYTHQTKIITRQVQIRDEQRGGLRSIGKGLRNLWRNIKK